MAATVVVVAISKKRTVAKKKAKTSTAEAHQFIVVTDGRTYRRARYQDLIAALFPDPEEAKWALDILAPVLGPRLREHPQAEADLKQLTDEGIREMFFEALLRVVRPLQRERMPVASKGITAAVREELGLRTQREEDEAIALARTLEHHRMIVEVALRKAEKGKQPPPGRTLFDVARRELAEMLDIDDATLRKRLNRLERKLPWVGNAFPAQLVKECDTTVAALKEELETPAADPWPLHVEELPPTRSTPRRYAVISDDPYLAGCRLTKPFESREAAERYIAAMREPGPPPPSTGSQSRGK